MSWIDLVVRFIWLQQFLCFPSQPFLAGKPLTWLQALEAWWFAQKVRGSHYWLHAFSHLLIIKDAFPVDQTLVALLRLSLTCPLALGTTVCQAKLILLLSYSAWLPPLCSPLVSTPTLPLTLQQWWLLPGKMRRAFCKALVPLFPGHCRIPAFSL